MIQRSGAQGVVLLVDCCYGGAFERGLLTRAAGGIDVGVRPPGRVVIHRNGVHVRGRSAKPRRVRHCTNGSSESVASFRWPVTLPPSTQRVTARPSHAGRPAGRRPRTRGPAHGLAKAISVAGLANAFLEGQESASSRRTAANRNRRAGRPKTETPAAADPHTCRTTATGRLVMPAACVRSRSAHSKGPLWQIDVARRLP
jgi:hypothetical protein